LSDTRRIDARVDVIGVERDLCLVASGGSSGSGGEAEPPLTRFDEDRARAGFTRTAQGRLAFTGDHDDGDGTSGRRDDGSDQQPVELVIDQFLDEVLRQIAKIGARRAVLDRLTSMSLGVVSQRRFRELVHALTKHFRVTGVAPLLTGIPRSARGAGRGASRRSSGEQGRGG
jgi:hypothetical protein